MNFDLPSASNKWLAVVPQCDRVRKSWTIHYVWTMREYGNCPHSDVAVFKPKQQIAFLCVELARLFSYLPPPVCNVEVLNEIICDNV